VEEHTGIYQETRSTTDQVVDAVEQAEEEGGWKAQTLKRI
jgi:hypothetical protein